jgi:hypothetical protein
VLWLSVDQEVNPPSSLRCNEYWRVDLPIRQAHGWLVNRVHLPRSNSVNLLLLTLDPGLGTSHNPAELPTFASFVVKYLPRRISCRIKVVTFEEPKIFFNTKDPKDTKKGSKDTERPR